MLLKIEGGRIAKNKQFILSWFLIGKFAIPVLDRFEKQLTMKLNPQGLCCAPPKLQFNADIISGLWSNFVSREVNC